MRKFYTRRGDDGTTGLLGGGRVPKDNPRPETVGTIDEANAALGLARATCQATQSSEIILTIQRDLYSAMGEVAATQGNAERFRIINEKRVDWLEAQIEMLSQSIEPPKEFIVPGDTPAGAALDLARTIIRRAERRLVSLWRDEQIENRQLLRYFNRLSSLCFALELLETQIAGQDSPTFAKHNNT
jgi:cob(I)alamin adenosyltransferase